MAKNKLIEFAVIMLQEDFLQKIMMIAIMDSFSAFGTAVPALLLLSLRKTKTNGRPCSKVYEIDYANKESVDDSWDDFCNK